MVVRGLGTIAVAVLAAALAAGISDDTRAYLMAAALTALALSSVRHDARRAGALTFLLLSLFLYGRLSIDSLERRQKWVEGTLAQMPRVELVGFVRSFPKVSYGRASFEYETRVEGVECRLLVRAYVFVIGYGDSVRVRGRLRDPGRGREDRSTYLVSRALAGEFVAEESGVERLPGHGGNPLVRRVFWPLHDRLRRDAARGLGARAGIPLALLLGDRTQLGRRTRDAFVQLGISHLLALSGLHLGLVAGLLILVLRMLRVRSVTWLVLALALYVGTVGQLLSLYRAFVMAAVLAVAAQLHRRLKPVTALANAFMLILLAYPHAFFALAFQLSFLATFGVLLCVQRLPAARAKSWPGRVWHYVDASIRVSLSAQLWVAPIIFHYFERMSLLAPLGTLIFLPPVAVLLGLGGLCAGASLISRALGYWTYDGLGSAALAFEDILLRTADASPAVIRLPAPHFVLYYTGVVLLWYATGRWAWRAAGVVLVVLAFLPPFSRM